MMRFDSYEKLEDYKTETICQKVYEAAKSADSRVFFYKLRRRDEFTNGNSARENQFFDVNNHEEAKRVGQIYDPLGKHEWHVNLSWVLGIIHQKRDIVLLTPVTAQNIWRKDTEPKTEVELKKMPFSAFAREIAVAIKAGYRIHIRANQPICLSLRENPDNVSEPLPDTSNFTLSMIDPSNEEVLNTIHGITRILFLKIKEKFANNSKYHDSYVDYIQYCNACLDDVNKINEDELIANYLAVDDDFPNQTSFLDLLKALTLFVEKGYIYTAENSLQRPVCTINDFTAAKNQWDKLRADKSTEPTVSTNNTLMPSTSDVVLTTLPDRQAASTSNFAANQQFFTSHATMELKPPGIPSAIEKPESMGIVPSDDQLKP